MWLWTSLWYSLRRLGWYRIWRGGRNRSVGRGCCCYRRCSIINFNVFFERRALILVTGWLIKNCHGRLQWLQISVLEVRSKILWTSQFRNHSITWCIRSERNSPAAPPARCEASRVINKAMLNSQGHRHNLNLNIVINSTTTRTYSNRVTSINRLATATSVTTSHHYCELLYTREPDGIQRKRDGRHLLGHRWVSFLSFLLHFIFTNISMFI